MLVAILEIFSLDVIIHIVATKENIYIFILETENVG